MPCLWEICIETNEEDSQDNPFFFSSTKDEFIPGQEEIIKIYCRPQKPVSTIFIILF